MNINRHLNQIHMKICIMYPIDDWRKISGLDDSVNGNLLTQVVVLASRLRQTPLSPKYLNSILYPTYPLIL